MRFMTGEDLLLDTFLAEGEKANLDPDLLATIFDFLHDQRFVSAGGREHVRAELLRLIREQTRGG